MGGQSPGASSLWDILKDDEDELTLTELKRAVLKAKLAKLGREEKVGEREEKIAETPLWGRSVWDPAAGGDIPPEELRAGKYGRKGMEMLGPPLGEVRERAEIAGKLPFASMFGHGVSPDVMKPWAQMFVGPQAAEAMQPGMYLSPEAKKWQNYMAAIEKFSGILAEAKKRKPAEAEEWSPEMEPYEEPEAKREPTDIRALASFAQMMIDDLRRGYGMLEKEKIPEVKTIKHGEGLRRGEEIILQPTKPEEKPRAGILGEFDEWKETPGNENKSWVDFYTWRSNLNKDKATEMTLQEGSKELRSWIGLRKAIDDPTQLEQIARILGKAVPGGPTKDEQKEAMKRMIDDEIDYWRSVVESKKAKPGGRPDALGLRREIEAIRGRQ